MSEDIFDEFEEALGISTLDADAAQMHEMFTSLRKAGFTEGQAIHLVALLVDRLGDDGVSIIVVDDRDEEE